MQLKYSFDASISGHAEVSASVNSLIQVFDRRRLPLFLVKFQLGPAKNLCAKSLQGGTWMRGLPKARRVGRLLDAWPFKGEASWTDSDDNVIPRLFLFYKFAVVQIRITVFTIVVRLASKFCPVSDC